MTMTKKEKATCEAIAHKLRVAAAFHRTQPVEPDVPIPDCYDRKLASKGFVATGGQGYSPHVEAAWSTSQTHGYGDPASLNQCGSQGGRRLFSTPVLALRALRFEAEQSFAEQLARIDSMIERELSKPQQEEGQVCVAQQQSG